MELLVIKYSCSYSQDGIVKYCIAMRTYHDNCFKAFLFDSGPITLMSSNLISFVQEIISNSHYCFLVSLIQVRNSQLPKALYILVAVCEQYRW